MTVTELSKQRGERDSAGQARPARLSPLAAKHQALGATMELMDGWQVPLHYGSGDEDETARVRAAAGVADISAHGKLLVQGAGSAELLADLVADAPAHHPIELAPDEQLLVTPPGAETAALRSVEAASETQGRFITAVDMTGGLAGLLVAGPESPVLLSKLCALSFHPLDFPDRHSAQSSLAKVHAIIVRRDLAAMPAFALYVARSYADYIWESLLDAGQAHDIIPFGWEALAQLDNQETVQER